jgi:hypothetical protein
VRQVGGAGGNVEYSVSLTTLSSVVIEGTQTMTSPKTFGTITMPAPTTFSAGGTDRQVDGPGDPSAATDFMELSPATHGTLSTSSTFQTVRLSSGNYYFDAITAQGNFTLEIDLTSGDPINIYVVENAVFSQDTVLMVKGVGTGGVYVPISDAPELAALINWETKGYFDLGGGDDNAWTTIFGGIVYSTLDGHAGVVIDQRVDWYGALYAFDTVDLADHSRFNYVPIPGAVWLLGSGLIGLVAIRRRLKS